MKYREYLDNQPKMPMAVWKRGEIPEPVKEKKVRKPVIRVGKKDKVYDEADIANAFILGAGTITVLVAIIIKCVL